MQRMGNISPRYHDPATGQPRPFKAWVLYPSEAARIATVDSAGDLLEFGRQYGWQQCCFERRVAGATLSRMRKPVYSLNFLAMMKDFDAIEVTDAGVERLETPEAGDYRLAFWKAESTCWFRWAFERVEEVGLLTDYQ